MLMLGRRRGERIVIGDGPNRITLTVVDISHGKVRLGIEAPRDVLVTRPDWQPRPAANAAPKGTDDA